MKKETPLHTLLSELRAREQESARQMALRIGCTDSYLNSAEMGHKILSDKYMQAIIDTYQLPSDEAEALTLSVASSPDRCVLDISHLPYDERAEAVKQYGKR